MRTIMGMFMLAALAVGCGSSSEPEEPVTTAGEPDAVPSLSPDCQEVSLSTAGRIADGDNTPPAIEPVLAAAYDALVPVERTFFVAMEFDDPDAGRSVGVWAMEARGGRPVPPILSADEVARQVTVWPDGVAVGLLSVANGELEEAVACLDALR